MKKKNNNVKILIVIKCKFYIFIIPNIFRHKFNHMIDVGACKTKLRLDHENNTEEIYLLFIQLINVCTLINSGY